MPSTSEESWRQTGLFRQALQGEDGLRSPHNALETQKALYGIMGAYEKGEPFLGVHLRGSFLYLG